MDGGVLEFYRRRGRAFYARRRIIVQAFALTRAIMWSMEIITTTRSGLSQTGPGWWL